MIVTIQAEKTQVSLDLDQDIGRLTDSQLNDVQAVVGALDRRLVYKCHLRDLDANWFDVEAIKASWPDV